MYWCSLSCGEQLNFSYKIEMFTLKCSFGTQLLAHTSSTTKVPSFVYSNEMRNDLQGFGSIEFVHKGRFIDIFDNQTTMPLFEFTHNGYNLRFETSLLIYEDLLTRLY